MAQAHETTESAMSKYKKARLLLEGSSLTHQQIADILDTSRGYVYNISYDMKTNGGMQRAVTRYRKSHSRKSGRQADREGVNANKREWYANNRDRARLTRQRYYWKTGLSYTRRRWTSEGDKFLVENSGKLSDLEIARELNRTVGAIGTRRNILRAQGMSIVDVRTTIPLRSKVH